MISDLDIYRSANLLMKQHGVDDAKLYRILKAIDDLSSIEKPSGVITRQ
jgi:hypothetical protein